jgi:hypothetical protein
MPNPTGRNQYTGRGGARKAAAKKATTAKKKKPVPTTQTDKGGSINRIDAAAKMFGKGSKQHQAALKKWG